jgi:hypothetical protein
MATGTGNAGGGFLAGMDPNLVAKYGGGMTQMGGYNPQMTPGQVANFFTNMKPTYGFPSGAGNMQKPWYAGMHHGVAPPPGWVPGPRGGGGGGGAGGNVTRQPGTPGGPGVGPGRGVGPGAAGVAPTSAAFQWPQPNAGAPNPNTRVTPQNSAAILQLFQRLLGSGAMSNQFTRTMGGGAGV